jgi:hypothetical protein
LILRCPPMIFRREERQEERHLRLSERLCHDRTECLHSGAKFLGLYGCGGDQENVRDVKFAACSSGLASKA